MQQCPKLFRDPVTSMMVYDGVSANDNVVWLYDDGDGDDSDNDNDDNDDDDIGDDDSDE